MTLDDLYTQKGRITTQLEILQGQLQSVNKAIVDAINQAQKPVEVKPVEVTPIEVKDEHTV